jgi:NitT/TauT family transport system ATP-binding protein
MPGPDSPPKILIRDLRKSFRGGRGRTEALDGINLAVAEGEFFCVVGPSGCGKTTLLRIIAGLETASAGTLRVAHANPAQPLASMVFQEHSLFPWMTAAGNAEFGLDMRDIPKRERRARVMPLLEAVGLTRFRNHYPHQLSGGMKQRVSLVRAFVNDPEVLLMDEPFAALDAQTKLLLQEELVKIWEVTRKTVVYITHSIDEALALGDRIAVMTAAPGRFKEIIEVAFPRPRNIFAIRGLPEFAALSERIWSMLESEVRGARTAAAG